MDAAKNFSKVSVSTGYGASDTSIVLISGGGANLPSAPFNATWWNASDYPDPSDDPNVEIVRVTAISTDTLTITRAQEGTAASTKNTANKTYLLIAGLTAKVINTDLPATFAPISHTHTEAGIVLSDVTTDNVSTTKHGFAPKAPNDATKYLNGTGNYSVPSGGGSSNRYQISTIFESVTPFGVLENHLPNTGATTNGLDLYCNGTAGSYVIMSMGNPSSSQLIFSKNPTFIAQAFCSNPATAGLGTVYMGCGEIGELSNILAFGVSQHFGFKFIANGSSDYNISATCSDGTGETSTFIAGNGLTAHVYRAVMTSGSKIEYYVDGTLVATHTTHLPFVDENFFTFASSNSNTALDQPRILISYATLQLDQY
jgi:hypothetical protein